VEFQIGTDFATHELSQIAEVVVHGWDRKNGSNEWEYFSR
jgi:hypothetical protein